MKNLPFFSFFDKIIKSLFSFIQNKSNPIVVTVEEKEKEPIMVTVNPTIEEPIKEVVIEQLIKEPIQNVDIIAEKPKNKKPKNRNKIGGGGAPPAKATK